MRQAAAGQLLHNCPEGSVVGGTVFFASHSNRWNLVVEDYGDAEEINYCPYCGRRLEEWRVRMDKVKISAKVYLQKLAETLDEFSKSGEEVTLPAEFAKDMAESLHQISEGMVK
ncbi:hypothetical protein D3C71_1262900 [compost metagenome]